MWTIKLPLNIIQEYVESIALSSIVEYNEVAATAKTATKI